MDIGEEWGYREPGSDPLSPLLRAEIIQFGPPKSQKVRVRMLGGRYPGLDQWVTKRSLRAPWDEAEAYLHDERRLALAREASAYAEDSTELDAGWFVVASYPQPDGIVFGINRREGATVQIRDIEGIARDLGLSPQSLLDAPLAFVDRHGVYFAPFAVALRLIPPLVAVYADEILSDVRKEEQKLQDEAIHGHYSELWEGVFVPPERCAEYLRQRQPVFDMVRRWCGQEANERFDEVQALRAEVTRLRTLVLEGADALARLDREREAGRLRKAVGAEPPATKRRRRRRD